METLVKRLQEIKDEILRLKSENEDLRSAHGKKEKEIARLRQLIDIQNNSINQLDQKLKIKRIADGVSGSETDNTVESGSNRDLKFKINEMIREVDKIISLLHR